MTPEVKALVADMDDRVPGKGVLTVNELMAYMDICRQIAVALMTRYGKKVGTWRISKVAVAKILLDPKRK